MDQPTNIYQDSDSGFLVLDEQGHLCSLAKGKIENCQANVKVIPETNDLIETAQEQPALQPPPLVVRRPTPSFYFHPQDEEEVETYQKNIPISDQPQYSIEKIVSKLCQIHNLTSPEQQKKITDVAFAFLRDRRSLVETKQILLEAKDSLNLAVSNIDEVITFLQDIKAEINAKKGLIVEEKNAQVVPKIALQPKITPSQPQAQAPVPIPLKKPESASELKASEPKSSQPSPEISTVRPLTEVEKLEAKTIADSKIISSNFSQTWPPTRSAPVGKPPMLDVKHEQKLVGPVDELSTMNLMTFRRISNNPGIAVNKIAQKINSLGQESLSRKTKAITGWRASALYQQYLAVGQASMENSLQIEQVIEQLKNSGQEVMTLQEFEAISDLNRSLRY